MSSLFSRIYQHEKDLQTILELMSRVRPPEHLNDYPVRVDIEENLVSPAVRANTRLWFEENHAIAWACVDEFNNLYWEIEKSSEELLGAQIIEWGETCVRTAHSNRKVRTLDTFCREDYSPRIAFLKQFGFQQTEGLTIRMMRDLSEPMPAPKIPQGFAIRPIADMQEAAAVAVMHRLAFGTEYMATENRLKIMRTSEYDSSLDLLVIAPDGTIVANCICSVNKVSKIGNTDPISTHPNYQRMGLARALLLTGLRTLKARGMSFAQLGTSGDNLAMQRAAESVGFTVKYKTIWFAKEVD